MQQNFYQPNIEAYEQMAYYHQKRRKEKKELIITGVVIGLAIIAYLFIQTIASGLLLTGQLRGLYLTSPVFQNAFNIICVHFCSLLLPFSLMALILKKNLVTPLVPLNKIKKSGHAAWICLGMGCCLFANYVTAFVIELFKEFGYQLTKSEMLEPDSIGACILLVFSTAIVPALIEEFALRCCTLGVLRKYGKGFAVFAVSIVFGIIHGNVIQFVFAFIVGLALGYMTVRTESVVPAMFVHGFNNGQSVLYTILNYASSEKAAGNVISAISLVWMVLAIIAFFYLLLKSELFPKKSERAPKEPYALSFGTKLACLIPGFVVPFLALVAITITTIEKI